MCFFAVYCGGGWAHVLSSHEKRISGGSDSGACPEWSRETHVRGGGDFAVVITHTSEKIKIVKFINGQFNGHFNFQKFYFFFENIFFRPK